MELANKILEEYGVLQARIEELNAQFGAIITEYVQASFTQLQQQAPEIQRVCWTQGTPGFNDGEPCYFSVHYPEFFLDGSDEECWLYTSADEERAERDYRSACEYVENPEQWVADFKQNYMTKYGREYPGRVRPYPSNPDDARDYLENIKEFRARYSDADIDRIQTAFDNWALALSSIPESVMQTSFGDGSRISVTATGIDVEEYYAY